MVRDLIQAGIAWNNWIVIMNAIPHSWFEWDFEDIAAFRIGQIGIESIAVEVDIHCCVCGAPCDTPVDAGVQQLVIACSGQIMYIQ